MSPRRYLTSRDFPHPPGAGPTGRDLCCNPGCGKEVAKGRRRYCSQKCRDWIAGLLFDPHGTIFDRDRGLCQLCGWDIGKLGRILYHASQHDWDFRLSGYPKPRQFVLKALGLVNLNLWEIDHKIPVCEGGSNFPDNLRLLCVPCHKGETAKLAARRAEIVRAGKNNPGQPYQLNMPLEAEGVR